MPIEWFPGHMEAAQKAASETLLRSDVVIEMLDARLPGSSCNPLIEKLRVRAHRPALKVLNKADVADPARTQAWLAHYNALPETRAIALSSTERREVGRITKECMHMVRGRGTVAKPLRMMIMGVPNVGKSTLMNALLKRSIARVGDEPAVTKMEARHEIKPGLVLIDTAGMVWPRMADDVSLKLAAAHSIGPGAYDVDTVALALADILLRDYPEQLRARYGDVTADAPSFLEHIARMRSFVMKGGAPDVQKAALAFLGDFRNGVLGAMTLELP